MNVTLKLIYSGILYLLFVVYGLLTKNTLSESLALIGILFLIVGLVIIWTRTSDNSLANEPSNNYISVKNIKTNKNGGYLLSAKKYIDILFFLENGFAHRIRYERSQNDIAILAQDRLVRNEYYYWINLELRSGMRKNIGKWEFNDLKNEIRIDFHTSGVVLRCKLKESGNLSVNCFKVDAGKILSKEVFEYNHSPEIFWWFSDMPNLTNGGKRLIIT